MSYCLQFFEQGIVKGESILHLDTFKPMPTLKLRGTSDLHLPCFRLLH